VRTALVASSALIVLALIFTITGLNVIRVQQSLDDLSRAHSAADGLRAIDHCMVALESSQRQFLRTGDSTFAVDYRASLRALGRQVDSLHHARQSMDEFAGLAVVDSLLAIRMTQMNATMAGPIAGNGGAAPRDIAGTLPSGARDSLHAALASLARQQDADWLSAHHAGVTAAHDLVRSELAAGVVVVLLLLFAFRQMVTGRDARAVTDAALRRSEGLLDSIIDLVPLMVYVKDAADLRFVRFNRTAEQLTGLSRTQVIGHDDFELYPRPLAEHSVTLDRAVLASDAVRDVPEETLVAPNGAVRTLHTRKVAIHDRHGRPVYLLGVSEDISAHKRAEREIASAREEADAANRAQSAFLAGLTQELRTPLNSIMGFSQLLDEESVGPLMERQQQYIAHVLTNGRQLLDLVNDMLELSNVAAGRLELSRVPVSLQPVVQQSLAQIEPLAVAAELQLAAEFEAGMPTVLADPACVRQIVQLLLRNAIGCTPSGGRVTVRVGVSPNRSSADAVMLRLSVIDTGIGLRPEDLERVFIAFAQVNTGLTPPTRGAGVGLALARQLATLHGGTLWVESEFGLGSSFHLELPAQAPEVRPGPPAGVPSEAVRVTDAAVLVVFGADDAYAAAEQPLLHRAGVRLERVADADAALERLSTSRADVIALDVAVLGRDGVDVLRGLKADPRTAHIPLLITSVVGSHVRALRLGAFDWIGKPLQRDALVASVQQMVAHATTQHPLVVAADADPATLDVMRTVLEGVGCRVMTTTESAHAMHLAATQAPDAIVVDLNMPEMSGLELMLQLRQRAPTRNVPVILCSRRPLSKLALERVDAQLRRIFAAPDAAELIDAVQHAGEALR
jgi:PAS domain S-box-containing protein